jgi:outer membrane immunogenic protein
MKKLLLGGAALLALAAASPAMAADMAVKAPLYKAMAPIYNWTGFYVGGNVGYSWGRGETDFSDSSTSTVTEFRGVPPLTLCPPGGCPALPAGLGAASAGAASGVANMNGFLGGLQAGYNAQYNTLVLGLEADIQVTGQRGSVSLFDATNTVLATVDDKMPWFATFRGRIGFTPAPIWLLYLTGGGAVAGIDQDFSVGGPGAVLWSTNTTRLGWVIGGGAEAAIENTNWTVKAEFLHMDFGTLGSTMATGATTTTLSNFPGQGFSTVIATSTAASFNTKVTDNILRLGLNYRIMAR